MSTVVISPVMVRLKVIRIEVRSTLGTYLVCISYPVGVPSLIINYKTYHTVDAIFTGADWLHTTL